MKPILGDSVQSTQDSEPKHYLPEDYKSMLESRVREAEDRINDDSSKRYQDFLSSIDTGFVIDNIAPLIVANGNPTELRGMITYLLAHIKTDQD